MQPDTFRSVKRVLLVTAVVLLVPLCLNVAADADWSVFDFVLAAVLLLGAGTLLELAVRDHGNVVVRASAGLLGVAAMVLGEADDAPGLVGFGLLLLCGTVALSVRTVQRRV